MDLELYFDFSSTYSYPAVMTVEQAAAAHGLRVSLRPILLGPIFAAQGYAQPPFLQFSVKGEYTWRDLERVCADLGLPWRKPSVFPRRSLLAARVALIGMDDGWGAAFSRRVFSLNFAEDRDIDDASSLRDVLQELELPANDVLARALADDNRARLKAETARAEQLGVFGAPMFVVGGERFWGHDRMQQALRWGARLKERA